MGFELIPSSEINYLGDFYTNSTFDDQQENMICHKNFKFWLIKLVSCLAFQTNDVIVSCGLGSYKLDHKSRNSEMFRVSN